MQQNLADSIAILTRTPAALRALLHDLPAAWTSTNEGPNTWSPFEIVGHLIYAERTDWMPRIKTILQFGETRPFDPFDREGHAQEIRGKSLGTLLDEFAAVRSENLRALAELNLQPQDLERRGRHPALGAVTVSQLLATWAAHDLNHLHQMARVMAKQYLDAVGPFSKYLGVMHCTGHGS